MTSHTDDVISWRDYTTVVEHLWRKKWNINLTHS
jgi:hypothetical protein